LAILTLRLIIGQSPDGNCERTAGKVSTRDPEHTGYRQRAPCVLIPLQNRFRVLSARKEGTIEALRPVSPDHRHVLRRRANRRLELRPGTELNHAACAVCWPETCESVLRRLSYDDPSGLGYPTNRTTKRTPAGAFDSALLSDHTDLVTEARLNGQRGWRLTGGSGTRCADKGEPARQSGPDWLLYRWRPSRDSALRRADRRL
jgi:hypothetical protein